MGFCTREDRLEFGRGLAEIGTKARLIHERKYTDFVLMLATENLAKEIEPASGGGISHPALKRLEHLRDEAPRWIAFRRTGRWPPGSAR